MFKELDESICSAAAGRHMAAREESSNIGVLVENNIVKSSAARPYGGCIGSPEGVVEVVTRLVIQSISCVVVKGAVTYSIVQVDMEKQCGPKVERENSCLAKRIVNQIPSKGRLEYRDYGRSVVQVDLGRLPMFSGM